MFFPNLGEDRRKFEELQSKVLKWGQLVPAQGPAAQFAALATHIGADVESVHSSAFRTWIFVESARIRNELNEGIEDFGLWRRTRGNASYDKYVEAKNGHSDAVNRLKKAEAYAKRLDEIVQDYSGKFGSLKLLARACDQYQKAIKAAAKIKTNLTRSASLNRDDVALCLTWANVDEVPATTEEGIWMLGQRVSNYDTCRLLSARAAENAVVGYCSDLGMDVLDVSIGQVQGLDERWKDFDVLADGLPLDVKNARRSFSSPDTYVEHCVPRFKLERQSGEHVAIFGVLSDYTPNAMQYASGETQCILLGQVTLIEIHQLSAWMKQRFGSLLRLDDLWTQRHLPGWMFEHPDLQYAGRAEFKAHVADLLTLFHQVKSISATDVPAWLLTVRPGHALLDVLDLSPRVRSILSDLASLDRTVGLKRPSLYIYVIGLFLEALAAADDENELARVIESLIFMDEDRISPLGLIDTQHYVKNVIGVLVRIAAESRRKGLHFTAFRMPHPALLKGQLANSQWISLIAYCGGWLQEPVRVKCGSAPLFFGSHEICLACGHLVCDNCGYCSESCIYVIQRQSDVALKALSVASRGY